MFRNLSLLLLFCVYSCHSRVPKNIALWKPAKQSSTYASGAYVQFPFYAVDGESKNLAWQLCSHTACSGKVQPWWQVDFEKSYNIGTVTITMTSYGVSLVDFLITVYLEDPTTTPLAKPQLCYQHSGTVQKGATIAVHCQKFVKGRFLRITNHRGSSDVACINLLICDVKVTAVNEHCPKGFVRNEDSCFWFSPYATKWISARSYCKVLGGDLAVVDNQDTDNFLGGYLKRIAKKNACYYLGASDIAVENNWKWVDRKDHHMHYSNWAVGQPQSQHIHEHCLAVNESSRFKWHDIICSLKNYFICEVKP
ncbi:C-type lectin domain family 18 member A-like isoform X1 [Gigantopelta aegis]|uniref:C-type lectin domain family 18 member A-like isoform X1 n=1 Tax=Gigantopelta aegis TaxID=1735272 RepID=UPI001B88980F|nr:C-type lectin domain family 18 member A-like isoform X1 [Gigantopelta aegis]